MKADPLYEASAESTLSKKRFHYFPVRPEDTVYNQRYYAQNLESYNLEYVEKDYGNIKFHHVWKGYVQDDQFEGRLVSIVTGVDGSERRYVQA